MLAIKDILVYAKGHLVSGNATATISGISTDTRSLKKGDLFLALKGKNFNGHAFIHEAIRKGAGALLISEKLSSARVSIPVISVKDTLMAYGDLARGYRERFSIPIVAITGSVGKTTTKELAAKVLSARFRLLKNYQTENNEIGVAKTLFNLEVKHKLAVLEFGTNHFGEIKRLASIGKPTVAVLTNIGESHLEFLKNRQGVFKEKSDIFKKFISQDCIVYNRDDDFLRTIDRRVTPCKKVTFAIERKALYQAKDIVFNSKGLSFYVRRHKFSLKTLSRENIYNGLAAIALGRVFGLPWALIARSLSRASFPKGRQNICNVSGVCLIDDTYNANPTSVASALMTLQRFSTKGRKFFIFGDMRELGVVSARAHKKVGQLAAKHSVDFLLAYGPWSKHTCAEAKKKRIVCFHCRTHNEIIRELKKNLHPGDVVLVKGSRGMHMEKVVYKIKALHF